MVTMVEQDRQVLPDRQDRQVHREQQEQTVWESELWNTVTAGRRRRRAAENRRLKTEGQPGQLRNSPPLDVPDPKQQPKSPVAASKTPCETPLPTPARAVPSLLFWCTCALLLLHGRGIC